MFDLLSNARWCDIGIDLGTANCVVYKEKHGIYLREPSVVAYDQQTQVVLAIGDEAFAMVGKTPSHIRVRPKRRCNIRLSNNRGND